MVQTEIHTLNARDNVLLSFVHELAGADSRYMNRFIVGVLEHLKSELRSVQIDYDVLGPALTPRRNRREIALIFEIQAVEGSGYGYSVHNRVLSLLGRTESHSVLAGDLLGDQQTLAYHLKVHLQPTRAYTLAEVGIQLFCVYITNCSDSALRRYSTQLRDYAPFIGACDLTFSSEFRSYLSHCILPRYVQLGTRTLQAKGDEVPIVSAQNSLGYAFSDLGFTTVSIQESYFGLLLSYKIERPPAVFDEPDQYFALNALSATPLDLRDCVLEIEESKFKYLSEAKNGTLAKLGLRGYSKSKLEAAVRHRIHMTYLYRLRFVEEYRFAGFSQLLELDADDSDQPVRVTAGFGYDESRRAVRLVTLF